MSNEKPTLERVSSVKTGEGIVYVNTQSSRPGMDRGIRYMTPFPGLMIVPEQGDLVEVHELEDGTSVAYFCFNPPVGAMQGDYSLPELGEREFHLQLDGGTMLSFQSNPDDSYDIDLNASNKVSIDASGPVEINADSVTVNSSNSVEIDGSSINLGTDGEKLVTDVQTSTDADGHVTGISLTKTSKTTSE